MVYDYLNSCFGGIVKVLVLFCKFCKINKCHSDFPPSDISGWKCKDCRKKHQRDKRGCKSPREEAGDELRKCQSCKEIKLLEFFRKNKNCKFGRERTCSKCIYEKRNSDPEQVLNNKRLKDKWYQENKDNILKKYKEEVYPAKRKELISYQKEYYKKNKEVIKARISKWQKDNPAKKAEYSHKRRTFKISNGRNDLTAEQIKTLCELLPYCVICKTTEDLTIDHIISLACGGENTISNCTRMCRSCNSAKNKDGKVNITDTLEINGILYVIGAGK